MSIINHLYTYTSNRYDSLISGRLGFSLQFCCPRAADNCRGCLTRREKKNKVAVFQVDWYRFSLTLKNRERLVSSLKDFYPPFRVKTLTKNWTRWPWNVWGPGLNPKSFFGMPIWSLTSSFWETQHHAMSKIDFLTSLSFKKVCVYYGSGGWWRLLLKNTRPSVS